jgi:hypothetical protein
VVASSSTATATSSGSRGAWERILISRRVRKSSGVVPPALVAIVASRGLLKEASRNGVRNNMSRDQASWSRIHSDRRLLRIPLGRCLCPRHSRRRLPARAPFLGRIGAPWGAAQMRYGCPASSPRPRRFFATSDSSRVTAGRTRGTPAELPIGILGSRICIDPLSHVRCRRYRATKTFNDARRLRRP